MRLDNRNNDSCNKKRNLPRVSPSKIQESISINAFKKVMQGEDFLIRDMHQNDYGVDLCLEIILEKEYVSNYKIDVQIKDVKNSKKLNQDGSYSYKVILNNLNYLLNSVNSIFVIYLEDRDCFYWEWCSEIGKDIYAKGLNISETEQETYSYRFKKLLNEDWKSIIHKEIRIKFDKLLQMSEDIRLLGKNRMSLDDLNISINKENTKKALRICFKILINTDKIDDLLLITLYDVQDLMIALREGIITSRLAEGLQQILDINISWLNGAKEINELSEMIMEEKMKNMKNFLNVVRSDDYKKILSGEENLINMLGKNSFEWDKMEELQEITEKIGITNFVSKLKILSVLAPDEYNKLIDIDLSTRNGVNYKTITQVGNYRFQDNLLFKINDGSLSRKYFILDFNEVDSKDRAKNIYELDLYSFYLLISEISSAKQDIEDNIEIDKARKYLSHLENVIMIFIEKYKTMNKISELL